MTGHECSSQMRACFADYEFGETAPSRIKTGTTHFQNAATLLNRDCLLLQQANKLVAHFSSRAKKADAFFKISTSIRSRRFSCSSWRTRCCSVVSGLPMPRCPLCSALYCVTQRRRSQADSHALADMLNTQSLFLNHAHNFQFEAGVVFFRCFVI